MTRQQAPRARPVFTQPRAALQKRDRTRSAAFRCASVAIVLVAAALAAGRQSSAAEAARDLEVRRGVVEFEVGTNIRAIRVHGRSEALRGGARVRLAGDGLVVEGLLVSVSVDTLETGMALRDDHMRRYVFETADGRRPDIQFVAASAACTGSAGRAECELRGELAVRGTPRPFSIVVVARQDGASYRVVGDGELQLSDYGIRPPSQLGVKTQDSVKLHIDVEAAEAAGSTLDKGGRP